MDDQSLSLEDCTDLVKKMIQRNNCPCGGNPRMRKVSIGDGFPCKLEFICIKCDKCTFTTEWFNADIPSCYSNMDLQWVRIADAQ